MRTFTRTALRFCVVVFALAMAGGVVAQPQAVVEGDALIFQLSAADSVSELTVGCDNGHYSKHAFESGQTPEFIASDHGSLKGASHCRYELKVMPAGIDSQTLQTTEQALTNRVALQQDLKSVETDSRGAFALTGDRQIVDHKILFPGR